MFEILLRDWNLKPIFTQKWPSVDMNCGGLNSQHPWQFQPLDEDEAEVEAENFGLEATLVDSRTLHPCILTAF